MSLGTPGYPECNAKGNKMVPKYWNFHDDIHFKIKQEIWKKYVR